MSILLSVISVIIFFYFSFLIVKKYFKKETAIVFLIILIINPFIWFLIFGGSGILYALSYISLLLTFSLKAAVNNKLKGVFCFIGGLIAALVFLYFATNISFTTFFSDPGVINAINSTRGDQLKFSSEIIAKLLFNKSHYFVFWFSQFIKQYSFSNLFSLTGDVKDKVFPTTPFLLVFAPFFAYGLVRSFGKLKLKKAMALTVLMLIGGVASSFSNNMMDYNLLSFSFPLVAVFIALGINWLIRSKKSAYIFLFFICLNFAITFYKIFLDYTFYGFGQ